VERNKVRILLENLLDRLQPLTGGEGFQLSGILTPREAEAIRTAASLLSDVDGTGSRKIAEAVNAPTAPVNLDCSALDLDSPASGRQMCVDFGTAMSKAALIIDGIGGTANATIEILQLGVAGQQQEVSETMLISSVYITNEGRLLFGLAAVEASRAEGANGTRARVDNIKRYFSEGGLDSEVAENFNPTSISVTGRNLVLAYLAFFAHTINVCLAELGVEKNIERRYAMPCFPEPRSTEVSQLLKEMLGQAQVLADTFGHRFLEGIPLADFMAAVNSLPEAAKRWKMITDHLTEPLGVANVMFDENANINGIMLVIDVGAGTSDMSLYRLKKDAGEDAGVAYEAPGAARGIEQAGNYLDRLLRGYLLQKAGIGSDDARYRSAAGIIDLTVREIKENLFVQGRVFVPLLDGISVEVLREEFCDLAPVREFSAALQRSMQDMLEQVPEDWMAVAEAKRAIRVVCTGGGATLPMVLSLATGEMTIQGHTFQRVSLDNFPTWMTPKHELLRGEFPRTAVSLGGARKHLIGFKGQATVLAGAAKGLQLEGYYQKGT
jgi:molecular chaperone HscA